MHNRIARTIRHLASTLGPRPAGSPACLAASRWMRRRLTRLGLQVQPLTFSCPDFTCHEARLSCGGRALAMRVNRHSPSCDVTARVVPVSSMDELTVADLRGAILLLHGALAADAHFPRNFTFFRIASQDAQLTVIEQKAPAAIVFGTDQPMPLFRMEDSEVHIPNVTLPAASTAALLDARAPVRLTLRTESRPSSGVTLVARNRPAGRRLVLSAHYDTNHDAPGALDNAAGVAAMLETARGLLAGYPGLPLECVAFGGEDSWYPGDALYFDDDARVKSGTRLFVNFDGPGALGASPGATLATFNAPASLDRQIDTAIARTPGVGRTEPWMQSDHAFAVALGMPTLACSSPDITLGTGIIHNQGDTPDRVDARAIAVLCRMLIDELPRWAGWRGGQSRRG